MTRLNGLDTLVELRANPAYGQLKVVVLTTSNQEADKRKSLALGADGCLTKPASQQAMLHMGSQLVGEWNPNTPY